MNNAGSASAAANSLYNSSGNAFINTSPIGSTLTEGPSVGSGR
jgi:hypothetical protein